MTAHEKVIKTEHFQNLVAVAYSDGILQQSELAFLASRAEEYGLDKDVVNRIIDSVDNLEFIIPLNDEDREEQLADAVYMGMIDGEVHGVEYNLCMKIAEKLDFDTEYLDDIIELTKKLWKKNQ